MNIEAGQRLLHYRLTEKLGEGGMGVVWKALDTTLDREVAIKVLPEAFSQDVERLARFEREAKLLASLNHPNIAAIYGFHESAGQRFLAMELIPGEELAARLKRGALPVEQSLQVCRQIARALDAAHERGVIHRDLKPANVKLTPDDTVKVLDFGLAKAFETSPGDTSLSQSPTLTSAGTRAGMILGTAAYMSPEQARGQVVDKRTDVWAFGCVLYECLTGRQAFGGDTVSDILASILKTEPDWSALNGRCSARTMRLLRRCLEKDSGKRLRDIGDAGIEIDELLAGDPAASVHDEDRPRPASWLPVGAAGAAGLLAGALLWGAFGGRAPAGGTGDGPQRMDITFPESLELTGLTISPDGRSIALRTDQGYYLRRMNEFALVPIPDTELCRYGVFSPDSRSLAVFCYSDTIIGRGRLQRVSLEGGPKTTLLESATEIYVAAWVDDMIWIGFDDLVKLGRVPATGGEPEVVVDLSKSDQDRALRLVSVLPGGRDGLLHVYDGSGTRTELISLDTGKRRPLHDEAWEDYAPTGHLLRNDRGTVTALPFDLDSRVPTGPAVPVMSDVATLGHEGIVESIAFADADASSSGTLFYLPASDGGSRGQQIVVTDRSGEMQPVSESMPIVFVRYSPDGQLVSTVGGDLRLHNLADRTMRPLVFGDIQASDHAWMPDGKAVTYTGFVRGKKAAIYRHAIDGRTPPVTLIEAEDGEDVWPTGWSPDGSVMIYSRYTKDDSDLWLLPADGSEPLPLMTTEHSDDLGRFSPDGRWIAYESNQSGRQEIHVCSYDPDSRTVGPNWRVSDAGGTNPLWSPDGDELYYESFDRKLIAVQIRRSAEGFGALAIGERSELFDFGELGVVGSDQSYDVAPDGKHFVFVSDESTKYSGVRVVLNWFDELERLAPPSP